MKNIQIHYNDDYGGRNVAAVLKQLKLKMDQIDLANSIYNIDELLIESLTANVLIKKVVKTKEKKSDSVLPVITANKIQINNSNLSYGDSLAKRSVKTGINRLALKDASLDLQNQIVTSDNLYLSKSEIHYSTSDTGSPADTTVAVTRTTTEKSDWKVSVKSIDLDDNSLAYNVVNKPEIKNSFDADHWISVI